MNARNEELYKLCSHFCEFLVCAGKTFLMFETFLFIILLVGKTMKIRVRKLQFLKTAYISYQVKSPSTKAFFICTFVI